MRAPITVEGAFPTGGFAESWLFEEQSLPTGVQKKRGSPPVDSGATFAANQPGNQPDWRQTFSSSPQPAARGFSAHELIDPQAMPHWMDGQSSPPGYPPQDGQARLAASSLLDSDSLPNWLRENEQAHGHARQAPAEKGGPSRSSFLDANVLPEWLRNADQQQAGMPPVGKARPTWYDAPPTPYSVTVPTLPRP